MWTYAGSAQAFAFYGRLRPRERQRLLQVRDEAGRDLFAWRADGFEILFWPDHAVRELRIVEVEWA